MTHSQAINEFFNRFMDAYPKTSVPDDVKMPYLTYENPISYLGDGDSNMTVDLWFYTESEKTPNDKVKEIADAIGEGGYTLKTDNGLIWIKRGSPFAISVIEQQNTSVKRRQLNITIENLEL